MQKAYKSCQSCGMPLKRDANGGGTESNGAISKMYCSHCYIDGEFSLPDITALEMKERVRSKLIEFGIPKFLTGFFVSSLHNLERWK